MHITHAGTLIQEAKNPNSCSVMLHELAHAYHERVLGFNNPEIEQVYKEFCDSRKFDRVASSWGQQKPHYGLTDHKEYFAEMTETFFVANLKSQRGEFDEALAMVEQAMEKSSDTEGHLASLKALVEERRDAAKE